MDVISLKSIFVADGSLNLSPETRAALAGADVIVGVDVKTGHEYTLYGTPSFEESITVGHSVALRTVRVELDQQAGELNKLIDLLRSIKCR